MAVKSEGRWFLSFDPATKSLAYSLCWVDFGAAARRLPEIQRLLPPLREVLARAAKGGDSGYEEMAALAVALRRAREVAVGLRAEIATFFRIAAGGVEDLFPGVDDRTIPTVRRIQAVARFVEREVHPLLKRTLPVKAPLRVLVEYQMGGNSSARSVSDALLALFADFEAAIVAPALKNKVFCSDSLHYSSFAALYSNAYSANKAHALRSFKFLEATFGSGVPSTIPDRLRGHIADSVMQTLGHVLHGEVCDSF
jgi:hypothetical protein